MKKTKGCIAVFSAYLLPHLGGIERYVDNLSKQFVKLGIFPILVTANYDNLKDVEEINGVLIIRLPVYSVFKNRYPIIKHNKKYRELMKKLDDYDIDTIIVNTRFHLTSHVGARYANKKKIPVYLIEHGSNYVTLDNKFIDFFANRYEDFLTWKLKKKVNGFYGVSKACGEWLQHFNIQYDGVWYNSIDCEQDVPQKEKHSKINFLYAGRLIQQKGVENILESFSQLLKEHHNIHLVIAGDGPLLDQYKKKYNNKQIEFTGKLEFKDLLKLYAKTDIFLYPPLWPEGLPTSILEAGLMSCAVIGTAQGGIKEIIRNEENGLIVETTVDALKMAMKDLIENEKKRENLAKQLNKTIMNKFSWSSTAKKVVQDIGMFDSKKKVLHLLPSNSFSGAENVACTIIENNSKYDMYYCCPRGPIETILKDRKINYIPISKLRPYNVKKICLENHIDIIHAHDYKASFCAALSGFKGKIISQLHVNWEFSKKWNLYTILYRLVMHRFVKIIAVSQEVVDDAIFAKNDMSKFVVITNVVDKKRVIEKSCEFKTNSSYDLIFVARIEPVKNPLTVIEITNKLYQKYKNIKTCMIGAGSLENDCRDLIHKYGLENTIDFLGFQTNPFPYIKNSKIALLPSTHEGLPMSVIECMILNVPVLNSGVDGLATLFENNPDYICKNIDEYCERISLILDKKLNLEKKCQSIICDAVDMKKYIDKVNGVYE